MATKILLLVFVLCAVVEIKSYSNIESNRMPEYVRIKRAKYYSSPPTAPMKFYRIPPVSHPISGVFSYTPPPNYMRHEDSPYPGSVRQFKVSKRQPVNDGLADDDIENLIKNLSKQDLDKIVEFAGERQPHFDSHSSANSLIKDTEDVNVYKQGSKSADFQLNYMINAPFLKDYERQSNYGDEYSEHSNINKRTASPLEGNVVYKGPYAHEYVQKYNNNIREQQTIKSSPRILNNNPYDFSKIKIDTQESIKNNEFAFMKSYIEQELLNAPSENIPQLAFTDSKEAEEEVLPKPVNLRENIDHEISYTHNVPTHVKDGSYKVENFGQLPLMDYNSKLHTVSSYHVPHYSVVSQASIQPTFSSSSSQSVSSQPSQNIKAPKIEAAPPSSAAQEQSDAHLKAIKIWTHRSRGTAYTLHDDGTLSLEKQFRQKPMYGQP